MGGDTELRNQTGGNYNIGFMVGKPMERGEAKNGKIGTEEV